MDDPRLIMGKKGKLVFKTLSLEDVDNLPDETNEQIYRRAYRDGWVQALNAIGEMMFERHISRDKAYLACWNHWEQVLFEWERRAEDPKVGMEFPPRPL